MTFLTDDIKLAAASAKNYPPLANASFTTYAANRSCGDSVTITAIIKDDVINQIGIEVSGCLLTKAGATKAAQYFTQKTLSTLTDINEKKWLSIISCPIPEARRQCILMGFKALQQISAEVR